MNANDLLSNIVPNNEMVIAKKIANIISKLIVERNNQNLTQSELAEKCGLKQSAIARMENLQVMPRIDTLVRVATFLNVEIVIQDELAEVKVLNEGYSGIYIAKANEEIVISHGGTINYANYQ